jgi:exopolyphosphatase/guanosine-5'-triphosphate,3'-diphosphate pyrophosphatase
MSDPGSDWVCPSSAKAARPEFGRERYSPRFGAGSSCGMAVPEPKDPENDVPLVAVIDIGSNTIRLVEYEIVGRAGLRIVRAFKEVPRLARGGDDEGALSREIIESGARAVRRLVAQLPPRPHRTLVAVATSAVRDAPNRERFLDRVESLAGVRPRVLSGTEEGRYAYLGVSGAWMLAYDVVVDLGGGSMQVVRTQRGALGRVISLPIGTVRLTDRFLAHDPPRDREVEALRDHVRELLDDLPDAREGARVFAVGGTARALARTSMELTDYPLRSVHGYPLRIKDLKGLTDVLRTMPAKRRRDVPGVDRTRADVIVAGLVALREVADRFDATELIVSAHGIRDGLAQEAAHVPPAVDASDLVERTAVVETRSFNFSLEHGRAVAETALDLFDTVRARDGWGQEERLALHAAALLHDVGSVIDTWNHALHSAYILRHTPVGGLTHRAAALAVIAVSGHEGEPLPEGWRRTWRTVLPDRDLSVGERLGAILFLAERLAGRGVAFRLARESPTLLVRHRARRRRPSGPQRFDRLEKHIRRTLGLALDVTE